MLNRDKVIESFHQLGFVPRVGEFEDRILIQKCVLLLQLKGLGTTCPYRLHTREPYSEESNMEAFADRPGFESPISRGALDRDEQAIVAEFGETFELRPNRSRWRGRTRASSAATASTMSRRIAGPGS